MPLRPPAIPTVANFSLRHTQSPLRWRGRPHMRWSHLWKEVPRAEPVAMTVRQARETRMAGECRRYISEEKTLLVWRREATTTLRRSWLKIYDYYVSWLDIVHSICTVKVPAVCYVRGTHEKPSVCMLRLCFVSPLPFYHRRCQWPGEQRLYIEY